MLRHFNGLFRLLWRLPLRSGRAPVTLLFMVDSSTLKKFPFLETLTADELKALAEVLKPHDVIAGDTLFSEGSPAKAMYLVRSGSVDVLKRGSEDDARVTTFGPGATFGEMAYFDQESRTASCEAKENCQLYELSYKALDDLVATNPALGVKIFKGLMRSLCRRVRQTTADLSSLKELKLKHL